MTNEVVEVQVGDDVLLQDKSMRGESRMISAKFVEVRTIMGMQTYVVETEHGKRKVVSPNQVQKA